MKIALDYDDTYTKDPRLWKKTVRLMKHLGHTVMLVTNRGLTHLPNSIGLSTEEPRTAAALMDIPCILCGPFAKREVMDALGEKIDIWIDDHPEWVFGGPWQYPNARWEV